jgi:protease-4
VRDVAAGRGLDEPTVRALADRAPLSAQEARDAGLIDRLGYRDEVYAELRESAGDDARLLFADHWSPPTRPADLIRRRRGVVALVEGSGEIVLGRGRPSPRGPQLGSNRACAAFRAAREDERVKAVLFRIDSPGGSAVASDAIRREVELTRRAGKPVIVSMASVAGSGGYYIACPADVILAEPATITGSIGVFGGKVVIEELLEKVGLTSGAVERGSASRMFSLRRRFTEDERVRLGEMLDRVYTDFVQKVADGRGMTYDAVHEIARGRIWSGVDAVGNGLVDELGGLRDAAALARERGKLPADARVRPALHVPPLAQLKRPTSSDDPRAAAAISAWGDLAALATALGLPTAGPLRMPDVRLA